MYNTYLVLKNKVYKNYIYFPIYSELDFSSLRKILWSLLNMLFLQWNLILPWWFTVLSELLCHSYNFVCTVSVLKCMLGVPVLCEVPPLSREAWYSFSVWSLLHLFTLQNELFFGYSLPHIIFTLYCLRCFDAVTMLPILLYNSLRKNRSGRAEICWLICIIQFDYLMSRCEHWAVMMMMNC